MEHLITDLVRVDGRFQPGLVNKQQYVFEGLGGGREPMSTTMKVREFLCVRVCASVCTSVCVCVCVSVCGCASLKKYVHVFGCMCVHVCLSVCAWLCVFEGLGGNQEPTSTTMGVRVVLYV